jgi:hypothetical protein
MSYRSRNVESSVLAILIIIFVTMWRNDSSASCEDGNANRYAKMPAIQKGGEQTVKTASDMLYPNPEQSGMKSFRIPQVRNNTPQMQDLKMKMINRRRNGETLWGSEHWMKPVSTYQRMDTPSLVRECFSRSTLGHETAIFDDPLMGLIRLQVFHDGFQELFSRRDFWQGIMVYLDDVAKALKPDIAYDQLVMHSINLNGIVYLFEMDSFADQIAGHEQEYLDAHLRLIHAFISFIDHYNPPKTGGSYGFYREPIVIASQAVALHNIIRPAGYSDIEPELTKIQPTGTQDIRKVRQFLQCVVQRIEKNKQSKAINRNIVVEWETLCHEWCASPLCWTASHGSRALSPRT